MKAWWRCLREQHKRGSKPAETQQGPTYSTLAADAACTPASYQQHGELRAACSGVCCVRDRACLGLAYANLSFARTTLDQKFDLSARRAEYIGPELIHRAPHHQLPIQAKQDVALRMPARACGDPQ